MAGIDDLIRMSSTPPPCRSRSLQKGVNEVDKTESLEQNRLEKFLSQQQCQHSVRINSPVDHNV